MIPSQDSYVNPISKVGKFQLRPSLPVLGEDWDVDLCSGGHHANTTVPLASPPDSLWPQLPPLQMGSGAWLCFKKPRDVCASELLGGRWRSPWLTTAAPRGFRGLKKGSRQALSRPCDCSLAWSASARRWALKTGSLCPQDPSLGLSQKHKAALWQPWPGRASAGKEVTCLGQARLQGERSLRLQTGLPGELGPGRRAGAGVQSWGGHVGEGRTKACSGVGRTLSSGCRHL